MRVLSAIAAILCVGALKVTKNTTGLSSANHNVSSRNMTAHAVKATQADVDNLHQKLEDLAQGLEGTLESKLSATKIGPEMKVFVAELKKVLVETKAIKDPAVALKKLQDARAGMAGLTADLTERQEALMKEDESQKESLLLGVLMTRQKDAFAKQLEVLKSVDFADLPVSKYVLTTHNNKSALFEQVAGYLDAHKGKVATNLLIGKATQHNDALAKVESLAKSFETRVASLEKSRDVATKRHNDRMEFLKKGAEKVPKSAKAMQAMMKREERSFKKWSVMQERDIQSMRDAVKAIKSHDVKALEKAKRALEASVRALQNKNNGFLVLLQMGHQFMERDCPYCAAQCVDKCHQEGQPYVTCLTQCADAGKGQ